MTPEEFHKRYGYWPSKELQEAWETGPQATDPFKDHPVRKAVYEFAEPGTTENVLGENPSPLNYLHPNLLMSGIADVVTDLAHPNKDPSKMDWAMGILDTLGIGGAKAAGLAGREALRSWRANMPNLLEFVSGRRFFQPAGSLREGFDHVLS